MRGVVFIVFLIKRKRNTKVKHAIGVTYAIAANLERESELIIVSI